jgi:hypothetical protein
VSRSVLLIIVLCGAGLAATAFLPSWEVRGDDTLVPIGIVAFLGGHVLGAIAALVAVAWLAGARWPRAIYYTQAALTGLVTLFVGLLQHLLAWDCLEHKGKSPDVGVTTVPAVIAALLWWCAFVWMVTGRDRDPRFRSGRIIAASGAVSLVWFATFALGNATHVGNHVALVASLFLMVAGWSAAN